MISLWMFKNGGSNSREYKMLIAAT